MKILLAIILISVFIFAKEEDYSEMSTQELLAIIGYVESNNKAKFEKELEQRVSTMNSREKEEYEKNKDKLK